MRTKEAAQTVAGYPSIIAWLGSALQLSSKYIPVTAPEQQSNRIVEMPYGLPGSGEEAGIAIVFARIGWIGDEENFLTEFIAPHMIPLCEGFSFCWGTLRYKERGAYGDNNFGNQGRFVRTGMDPLTASKFMYFDLSGSQAQEARKSFLN